MHYFISDTHIGAGNLNAERRLEDFITRLTGKAAALYILGDLFEFWFDFRRVVPKVNVGVLGALYQLRRCGTKIFLLRGNHDIWFNGWLERELGLEGVFDELTIAIDGLNVYLAHGDALDKSFVSRFFRRLMRSRFNARLFSSLHPDLGVGLAHRIAAKSRLAMRQRGTAAAVQAQLAEFARRKIAEGFDVVMLGHSHIPEALSLERGLYINTGDWINHFTYGLIKEGRATLEGF